jgi:hypothetical protein
MWRTTGLALAAAAALAACGGGGSDGPAPPATSFEVAAAVQRLATGPDDVFDLSGNVVGEYATLHFVHREMSAAPFETYPMLDRMRREVTMHTAATGPVSSWEDDFIALSSRMIYGMDTAEGHAVSTTSAPYPVTARIGESGLLFHADEHDHMTNGLIGKSHVTWSMEATGRDDHAYFCINSDYRDMHDVPTGVTQKDCYRIDASGQLIGMRVTLAMPPLGTFTFQ